MKQVAEFSIDLVEPKHSAAGSYDGPDNAGSGMTFGRPASAVSKRAIDLLGAVTLLVVFAPLILAAALLILAMQGRPIVIRHTRVGRGGRPFPCLKFRTMVRNADDVLKKHIEANPVARREWEATRKLKDDPRVTPLGAVMRKLSIDELPQVVNVLRGEMSLVGPRPIVADEMRFYGQYITHYHESSK